MRRASGDAFFGGAFLDALAERLLKDAPEKEVYCLYVEDRNRDYTTLLDEVMEIPGVLEVSGGEGFLFCRAATKEARDRALALAETTPKRAATRLLPCRQCGPTWHMLLHFDERARKEVWRCAECGFFNSRR